MKTICNWYHDPVVLSDDGVQDGAISHGMCPDCGPRFMAWERPKEKTMKIGISETTARKALAIIPADTQDQDMQQLRARIQGGLKAVTGAGRLNEDELATVIGAVRAARDILEDILKRDGSLGLASARNLANLQTAAPKLQNMLAREVGGGA